MADVSKVKRNIQRMLDQGAPESDIDAYVAEEGLTPEALRAAPASMTAAPSAESVGPAFTPEVAAAAEGRNLPSPGGYAPPPVPAGPGRALQIGAQGVGRGLADIAGMPSDIVTGGANLLMAGADLAAKPFGGSVDYRFPQTPLSSDNIAETAGDISTALGAPPVDPATPQEKLSYNINRYGTQALTTGAGLMRAGAAMAPTSAPRISDAFIKPYAKAPLKTIAGDTVGGAGAGAGLTGSQEFLPQSVRDAGGGAGGTIADLLAMLAGGVGAGTTYATAVNAPRDIRSILTAKRPAATDLDPATGQAFTNRAFDKAATKIQQKAVDPSEAIQTIDNTVADFGGLPTPTTGLMSGDTGLINMEQALRVKNGGNSLAEAPGVDPSTKAKYSFVERDTALRDAAVDQVNSLRPQGADPQAFPQRAGDIVDMRAEAAQRPVDKAAGEVRAVETAQRPIADELNSNIGQAPAASRTIDDVVRQTRTAEQQQSAALYNDPAIAAAEVPVQPLRGTAEAVAAQGSAVSPLNPVVEKYTGRFAEMEGNASMADVNRLRAEIEADIKGNLDNGAVVQQLRAFKDQASGYAQRLAEEGSPAGDAARAASENFATRVQPNFREGAGGRVDATLKSNPNSPSVQPSEMASNFLTRPEDAQALMRIAELRGNTQRTTEAARTWMLDQIASKGIAKGGAVDGEKLALWRNKNNELIGNVPGLRQEIDGLVRQSRTGEALKAEWTDRLAQAEARAKGVEGDAGILTKVRGQSPNNAAGAVFADKNPERAMTDLVNTVGKNPAARDGLKAAVAEHFAAKVSGVAPQNVSEGSQNINFAQLTKEFDKSRATLAKLYSPEEMNTLAAAQKVLAPLAKRAQQGTVGSATAERDQSFWRTFEAGAKLHFGMLKGGGITRTAKLIASQLDDGSDAAADRLIALSMFDPKRMKQLLSANVKPDAADASNSKVRGLLRKGEVGRQMSQPDDEEYKPLEVTVRPNRK